MNSKDWKLVLVSTLTATLLAACGSNNEKKTDEHVNPHAGIWVNSSALSQYDKKIVKGNDDAGFCHTALSSRFRAAHGVKLSGSSYLLRPNALSIENNGDVRLFEIVPNAATRAQGNVLDSGIYAGSAALSDRMPVKGIVILDAKAGTITVTSTPNTEVSKKYIRSDRKTVAAYMAKVQDCVAIKNGVGNFAGNYEMDDDGWYKPVSSEGDADVSNVPVPKKRPNLTSDDSGDDEPDLTDADLELED